MKFKHLPIIIPIIALAFSSCKSNNDIPVAKEPQMIKLTAPGPDQQ